MLTRQQRAQRKDEAAKKKKSKVCQFIQSIWCLFQITQLYFFPLIIPKAILEKPKKKGRHFPTRWGPPVISKWWVICVRPTYHGAWVIYTCVTRGCNLSPEDPNSQVSPAWLRAQPNARTEGDLQRRERELHGEPLGGYVMLAPRTESPVVV